MTELISEIQKLQNKYVLYKKKKDPLGMLLIMWEIGDFLVKQRIMKPHALGWKIEDKKAYISRPTIFRSFVIRRIWDSKAELKKQLYGVKSVNSVIEMFPFLDQNNKWNLPKEKLNELMTILNTRPAKEFNLILQKTKSKFIGIKTDRKVHFSEIIPLKEKFFDFFILIKNKLENESIDECLNFTEMIGKDNLKNLAKVCLKIGTEKELNLDNFQFRETKNKMFNCLINELKTVCKNKQRKKIIKNVIKPTDLIKMVDFCNSILKKEFILSYRARSNIKFPLNRGG